MLLILLFLSYFVLHISRLVIWHYLRVQLVLLVPRMFNSKLNSNRVGDNRSGLPTYYKQPPVAMKKIPLRDVQNDNRSLLHSQTQLEGGAIADAVKLSGTKRLAPDYPQSPPCRQFFNNNVVSDHIMHVRRRFEMELGNRRIQDWSSKKADTLHSSQFPHNMQGIPQQQMHMKDHNEYCAPVLAPIPSASLVTFSFGEPSVPLSMGEPNTESLKADSDHRKVTSEIPHSVHSKVTDDQHRNDRFLHLKKVLKHCDEFDQNDYIQSKSSDSNRAPYKILLPCCL